METEVDYEQVGRFIYAFVRVRGSFDAFCGALEPGAQTITPEMPVSQYADRTQAVLTQRYGAGSSILVEFNELRAAMLAADKRMSEVKAGFDSTIVPTDAETNRVLGVPARLEHIRCLINAA